MVPSCCGATGPLPVGHCSAWTGRGVKNYCLRGPQSEALGWGVAMGPRDNDGGTWEGGRGAGPTPPGGGGPQRAGLSARRWRCPHQGLYPVPHEGREQGRGWWPQWPGRASPEMLLGRCVGPVQPCCFCQNPQISNLLKASFWRPLTQHWRHPPQHPVGMRSTVGKH